MPEPTPTHKATDGPGRITALCGCGGYQIAEQWENVDCRTCLGLRPPRPAARGAEETASSTDRPSTADLLTGHEGVTWQREAGGWTCRCGAPLTEPGHPARPEDALEPWRCHVALVLSNPVAAPDGEERSARAFSAVSKEASGE